MYLETLQYPIKLKRHVVWLWDIYLKHGINLSLVACMTLSRCLSQIRVKHESQAGIPVCAVPSRFLSTLLLHLHQIPRSLFPRGRRNAVANE